jgi:hypothetical protein
VRRRGALRSPSALLSTSSSKRERLGIAIGIELLTASGGRRLRTTQSMRVFRSEGAAGVDGARAGPTHEERIGSQADDVVDAGGEVIGLLQGADG